MKNKPDHRPVLDPISEELHEDDIYQLTMEELEYQREDQEALESTQKMLNF